ncbi:hypothetical protein P7K49_005504 [Saguinus oedipus]|uniref:Uncharacterized protein n=1 Tax=Saguinus oedipus TaxID=9490 RepID=A0ABQ9W1F8_SAGOE|nr:hypothetical protein P7K49_005504 [Saguinus oedipus]
MEKRAAHSSFRPAVSGWGQILNLLESLLGPGSFFSAQSLVIHSVFPGSQFLVLSGVAQLGPWTTAKPGDRTVPWTTAKPGDRTVPWTTAKPGDRTTAKPGDRTVPWTTAKPGRGRCRGPQLSRGEDGAVDHS